MILCVLFDWVREVGICVCCSYGLSEMSGGCVYDGVLIGVMVVWIVDGEVWLGGLSFVEGYLGD